MHYLIGQFALHSHQSLLLPISAVKNILKKFIILQKQQIKAQKPIRFKSRPMKFKSAFRAAEAKWRDQISLTAGNETEVPIYFGSRK